MRAKTIVLFVCVITVLCFSSLMATALPQWGKWNTAAWEPLDGGQKGPFIAAFEWSVARSGNFVWPFETMRPANYDSVRMVVETMPWVLVDGKKGKKPAPLFASDHLRINGRLQKPVRPVRPGESKQTGQQEFLVKLDQGRLRLTLIVPPGTSFDPEHALIRVKLYESIKAN